VTDPNCRVSASAPAFIYRLLQIDRPDDHVGAPPRLRRNRMLAEVRDKPEGNLSTARATAGIEMA